MGEVKLGRAVGASKQADEQFGYTVALKLPSNSSQGVRLPMHT